MATATAHTATDLPGLENWDGVILVSTESRIVESDGFREVVSTCLTSALMGPNRVIC